MILTAAARRSRFAPTGASAKLTRVKGGKTVKQFAAAQAASGFTVWKSYDEPGGYRDQMYALARDNPSVTKLVKIGTTLQGREILALKVTQGARGQRDGSRPAVLFSATQHAREWIATEIDRRLMYHYIEGWRDDDKQIKKLLKTTELWFVPVMNPDGYQYTFDTERLWRKNLRDNDGDGQTTNDDGVDPNRNYPEHFKYDEEGSSKIPSSQTYRGPARRRSPRRRRSWACSERVGFEFNVNYHSNGQWLLYPEGWQIGSPTADDPIYFALSGNLDRPAIAGFHPGLSSDVLYVTNGEANDYLHKQRRRAGLDAGAEPGLPGCGFVFPDDEALVQAEFERNLPFAESVANSAADPDDPKSSLGIKTKPFYIRQRRPVQAAASRARTSRSQYSYGDPQPVQVLAKRALGAVTRQVQDQRRRDAAAPDDGVDGRREVQARVRLLPRHARHGDRHANQVTPSRCGSRAAARRASRSPTRRSPRRGNRMLVVAAEDYTGASPVQTPGPHYAQYYLDALAANGIDADVYDVDARGRTAPDQLGVLSHYEARHLVHGRRRRDARSRPGRRQRRPARPRRDARDARLPGRGRPGALHRQARRAAVHRRRRRHPVLRPEGRDRLQPVDPRHGPAAVPGAARLAKGGDQINDVLQYWFGGMVADRRRRPGRRTTTRSTSNGIGDPFTGLSWGLNGAGSADNQDHNLVVRGDQRRAAGRRVPAVRSRASARWDKPGGPFDPHTGNKYVYSQIADVDVQAAHARDRGAGRRRRPDVLDVVRHRAGLGLPRGGGAHGRAATTGRRCPTPTATRARTRARAARRGLADAAPAARPLPDVTRWRGVHVDRHDAARGTPHREARTAGSSGSIDLDQYAGKTVEISIAYISDWGTQNLGVFLDDFAWPGGRPHSRARTPVAGRSQVRRRAAAPTRTTSRSPMPAVSQSARRSPPRSHCCSATGSRPSPPQGQRNLVMGRIASYLLR